ncbi:MAG: UvrB/UvrC motif-containing protein [Eubacteriales bacterium]
MLCERCKKNEATFYYHENVNGAEKTYSLCRDCADELEKKGEFKTFGGFTPDFTPFESLFAHSDPFEQIDNLFGSLFAPANTRQLAEKTGAKKCPLCGMTMSDFAREGKAGCPTCYETFAEELEPTLGRIHGRTTHSGRSPMKFREKNERKNRIRTLEAEQKEAIKAENYERAAEIRDELKNLRGNA